MSDIKKMPRKYWFTPENTPGATSEQIAEHNIELGLVLERERLVFGSIECDERVRAFHAEVHKRVRGERPTLRG